MRPTTILVIAGLVSNLACNNQGARDSMPDPAQMEGSVRLAGADPNVMVMLQPTTGGSEVQLTGEHLMELERLGGVTIAVEGPMMTSPRPSIDVRAYQIRSVNGQRPSVGIVISRAGELWLQGDSTIRLTGVPEGLRNQVGAKVWIVGRVTGGALQPESYGIIRDP